MLLQRHPVRPTRRSGGDPSLQQRGADAAATIVRSHCNGHQIRFPASPSRHRCSRDLAAGASATLSQRSAAASSARNVSRVQAVAPNTESSMATTSSRCHQRIGRGANPELVTAAMRAPGHRDGEGRAEPARRSLAEPLQPPNRHRRPVPTPPGGSCRPGHLPDGGLGVDRLPTFGEEPVGEPQGIRASRTADSAQRDAGRIRDRTNDRTPPTTVAGAPTNGPRRRQPRAS